MLDIIKINDALGFYDTADLYDYVSQNFAFLTDKSFYMPLP